MKKTLFICVIAMLVLAACTPKAPAPTAAPATEAAATEAPVTETAAPQKMDASITVMVPPWAEIPSELIDKFTKETGIKVDMQIVGWDEIHNKIAIAAAGNTAAADVVEVDWSWVGEFASTGWFMPLNEFVTEDMKKDIPLIQTFTAGGNILAIPYANDFRIGTYNKAHFDAAGIKEPPKTWDELVQAAQAIKKAGIVQYPLGFPLSASEGATTYFLLITLSRSGPVFNEDGTLNKENVLSTMQFIYDLIYNQKLVDPNCTVMIDREIAANMYAGNQSFINGDPGMLTRTNDPERSKVVGQTARMLVPGHGDVRSATFGLPEGIGIPVNSKNKEAAWKFIEWFVSPEAALAQFEVNGSLPVRTSIFSEYVNEGKLEQGDVLLEQVGYVTSFAPAGIPAWYPKFSLVVQEALNKVATGTMSPEAATDMIASAVDSFLKE